MIKEDGFYYSAIILYSELSFIIIIQIIDDYFLTQIAIV